MRIDGEVGFLKPIFRMSRRWSDDLCTLNCSGFQCWCFYGISHLQPFCYCRAISKTVSPRLPSTLWAFVLSSQTSSQLPSHSQKLVVYWWMRSVALTGGATIPGTVFPTEFLEMLSICHIKPPHLTSDITRVGWFRYQYCRRKGSPEVIPNALSICICTKRRVSQCLYKLDTKQTSFSEATILSWSSTSKGVKRTTSFL